MVNVFIKKAGDASVGKRKYVISYKQEAFDKGIIDWTTYITKEACYGLSELKATLKTIERNLIDRIDILSGDGANAVYLGTKNF